MDSFVIVIGRQFGCGGRKIGKKIAEELGVPYYDKTLLSEAAKHMGFNTDIFDRADERRPSFLRTLMTFSYTPVDATLSTSMNEESLYQAQSEVIRQLCERGSCVIVGRTADYVMRDHPGLISLFIHAPLPHRVKEIIGRGDASDETRAADMANKYDRCRQSYYNYYTNRRWGTADNYDLCFDSSKFDTDALVSLLRAHISGKR